jgi:hypothetical protein
VVGTGHDRDMRSSITQTLRILGHPDTIARLHEEEGARSTHTAA